MGKDRDRKHRRRRRSPETDISSSSDSEIREEKKRNRKSRHQTKRKQRQMDPEAVPDVADDLEQGSFRSLPPVSPSSLEGRNSDIKMGLRRRRSLETDMSSSSNNEIREEKKRMHARNRKSSRHSEKHRHQTKRKQRHMEPEAVLCLILERFPDVGNDLEQLLQLIDNGQGVDLKGVSDKSLVRLLNKLFLSLNLKENEKGVFSLPSMAIRTLKLIGSPLSSHMKSREDNFAIAGSPKGQQTSPSCQESTKNREVNDPDLIEREEKEDSLVPHKRRIIGPEMPSRELLAAAAELTRAEAELRDASLEVDNDLLIGPPPPAMVSEVESTNEAERFEEVTRIVFAEADKPYDVLAVNWRASFDNIKKRYWKLSLMVHPDKCSHPQAHQAFVMLNQAFKDLQDSDKRKAIDEKIKLKEEQEAFQAELKVMREAAQWRRIQGITLEGDEELLAFPKEEPKATRDEWMTELPPERKPGMMPVHSTSFNKSGKEGRGDTSVWTDTPLDKSRQAKQNYLEAYNRARELAGEDDQKKSKSSDVADLVDKYNSHKRSKSLVQKFREEETQKRKRKSKETGKEDWEGAHPWRPWDREKDLSAGRQKTNLDSDGLAQGLSSRFSSGSTSDRSFL